jgi:uncharacterized protein (TIGR01244 family)
MRLTAIALGILAAGALAFTGCASDSNKDGGHTAITTEKLEPYQCGTVQRLHTYKGVFLASQPAPADFEQAKKGGVKTVVNLRPASEIKDFDEKKVVGDLGLAYHNPAFGSAAELTDAKFDEVRNLLRTAERPILLHCASANRVGAVWMAYRVLDEGATLEQATAEAKIVGLKSPDLEKAAKDYIARNKKS